MTNVPPNRHMQTKKYILKSVTLQTLRDMLTSSNANKIETYTHNS